MIINHTCCIKFVLLVIFIYDALSHIHKISLYMLLPSGWIFAGGDKRFVPTIERNVETVLWTVYRIIKLEFDWRA